MKKQVGIITFHAAHNYGSSLQAYAIKKVYNNLGAECEIINFRTPIQKDQYAPLTKRKGFKYLLKNAFFLLTLPVRKRKYFNFEEFISKYLLTDGKEYSSLEQLMIEPPEYDLYVCGSDQIWNTAPRDASMAYFLPFANGKKVSYAPSFGQIGEIKHKDEIAEYLNSFDMISVREQRGKELVRALTDRDVPILVDPTLLLNKEEWDELSNFKPIDGKYIFFYSLFSTKAMIKEVKEIARKLGLKVVVSNISNQNDLFTGFAQQCDAGPKEFLGLIKNAELVVTSSFHGSVFSIIFGKPLLVYEGMKDKRISTLLKTVKLEECAFKCGEGAQKASSALSRDMSSAREYIETEKKRSFEYILNTLEL